jgi:hypothetical protein
MSKPHWARSRRARFVSDIAGQAVTLLLAQIFVKANQAKSPSPRRSEVSPLFVEPAAVNAEEIVEAFRPDSGSVL